MAAGKRALEQDYLLPSFLDLGIRRDGRAFPSDRLAFAAYMAGDDDADKHELSDAQYAMIAFTSNKIELRAFGTDFDGVGGAPEIGGRSPFTKAKHVSALYEAPQGAGHFTVASLCAILSDFLPASSPYEDMEEEDRVAYGYFDLLGSMTRVPGTDYTYDIKWIVDPTVDTRAAAAARDARYEQERAEAEANDPSLRGVGAIGKEGGCAAQCGYFAVFGSIYCSKCEPPPPPGPEVKCPHCSTDLSHLGPLRQGRHIERCTGN